VLKLYCPEADSPKYLERVALAADPIVSSVLVISELLFAFLQKELRGGISQGSAGALYNALLEDVEQGKFTLIPMGEDVRNESRYVAEICYRANPPISLRTLDGLHLASARLARCKEILSTDVRLRAAAALPGIL
jgi:predicted nucleic acid-binding protein